MHFYRVNIAFEGLRVGTTFQALPSPRFDALVASGYITDNGSIVKLVEEGGREALLGVMTENAKPKRPRRDTAEKE